MKHALLCYLLLGASVGLLAQENKKPCNKQDAIQAEKEASSLRNWTEVYQSYRRFSLCDDGAISEGYSDSIARLLSDGWDGVDQLNVLVSRDKGFERFVLQHIDELMSPAQAEKIHNNAQTHCPVHGKRLCNEIERRLKETGGAPLKR